MNGGRRPRGKTILYIKMNGGRRPTRGKARQTNSRNLLVLIHTSLILVLRHAIAAVVGELTERLFNRRVLAMEEAAELVTA